jgi:DNA-binding CsgD family transcriptional regulator
MKKLILVISKDPGTRYWKDCLKNNRNLCKLVIIDTQQEEGDAEFRMITLEPDTPNRLHPELIDEFLSEENQVYLLVCEPDNPLIPPEVFRKNNVVPGAKPMAQYYLLSERQRQIIHYLSRENSYKEIASILGISYHTVKHQIEIIYFKWNVKNKRAAIDLYGEYAQGLN